MTPGEIIRLIQDARDSGDLGPLMSAIPYAKWLGMEMRVEAGDVLGKLVYSPPLIGNIMLPALHGGTIGALLESTAVFAVMMRGETLRVPKTISLTIDYLRSGKALDTFAAAEMTKLGKRVASVRAVAWQEDRAKPIAVANGHFLLVPPDEDPAQSKATAT